MKYKLFAFDLDGTLLRDDKTLSDANIKALREMADAGAIIAFASGRLGSSMRQFAPQLGLDLAMLTLNGAAVYTNVKHGSKLVYSAPLPAPQADFLIDYASTKNFVLNYYHNDNLYAIKNERTQQWIDLYYKQTRTAYQFLDSFDRFSGNAPSKIIFVGNDKDLDEQEKHFRALWGDSVYICRTWDYYLEFLSTTANKGRGIECLADAFGFNLGEVAAFGDANNDIPMLQKAGLGVAMANAPDVVKEAAGHVSQWTNDEDGIAREWDRIKSEL